MRKYSFPFHSFLDIASGSLDNATSFNKFKKPLVIGVELTFNIWTGKMISWTEILKESWNLGELLWPPEGALYVVHN